VVRVFLVDDHEVVRRGLIDLLGADPELDVVGEGGSVAEAMARIPAANPDVAVLDVRLPDGNGIELCRDLLSRMPDLRCLILTSYTSDEAMLDAILAGASGYVVKDIKGMELARAVKDVSAGISARQSGRRALMAKLRGTTDKPDPLSGLTDQERTLLGLLSQGLTNKQIADRMFLAEKTEKNYVSRLLAKLGMERRTQAAVFATELKRSRSPREGTTTQAMPVCVRCVHTHGCDGQRRCSTNPGRSTTWESLRLGVDGNGSELIGAQPTRRASGGDRWRRTRRRVTPVVFHGSPAVR
jgi:two-component system, NarL family, response regulator DevR